MRKLKLLWTQVLPATEAAWRTLVTKQPCFCWNDDERCTGIAFKINHKIFISQWLPIATKTVTQISELNMHSYSLILLNMHNVCTAAPSSAPRDVTVTRADDDVTNIRVRWRPPRRTNGDITGKWRNSSQSHQWPPTDRQQSLASQWV